MPPLPDLLSDDPLPPWSLPDNSGNDQDPPPKVKSKNGKSKKKNESLADQSSKEKATKGTKRDTANVEPSPPSPEFFPSAPPEIANDYTSPVLAALGDRAFGKSPLLEEEDTWTSTIPTRASPQTRQFETPPVAESPTTAAPVAVEEFRGAFNRKSPPSPPHPAYRSSPKQRPLSQNTGNYLPTSPRGRPASMPQQYLEAPFAQYVKPQLYGAEAGFKSRSTSRNTTKMEFMAFDMIALTQDDASTTGDLVLLKSAGNSLRVFKVDREGVHYNGHLEGLRGQVISAKILPVATRHDQLRRQRPLVAVVVHGPKAGNLADSQHSEFDPTGATHPVQLDAEKYQTTVEVYSLKDRGHLATLYQSPSLEMELRPGERYPEAPGPHGALHLKAKGRFVIVTSAVSGEVYIYEAVKNDPQQAFRCIGKTWTSIQGKKSRTWSTSSAQIDRDPTGESQPRKVVSSEIAVASLSNRWLAIVPPVVSSKSTLHGTTDASVSSRHVPGLRSHTCSSQPPVTCELDAPLEDSKFNKVARDLTQEMLKGARWVGDQGMQAFKNYWNKPDSNSAPEQALPAMQQQFPPTHANDENTRPSRDPTLVSIIDLEKLSESQDFREEIALQPLATFSLADGCSFLSFNPSGIVLLTATTKGDVCYAWDLMRLVYSKSMSSQETASSAKPVVRQVARFGRVTIANIVDVIWAEPKGEKLAIVTDRGTVHVHDMPQTAFQWPPPLRPRRPAPPRKPSSDVVPVEKGTGLGAAFNKVSGGAQPMIAAVRSSGLSNWGGFNLTSAGVGAGVKSGRIVSTGLSKSMGAASGTMDSILRMGDTRLQLPGSAKATAVGSTRWLYTKDSVAIAVLGTSSLRMHSVHNSGDVKGKNRHSVVGLQLAEYSVPEIRNDNESGAHDGVIIGGHWPDMQLAFRTPRTASQPISFAEIETSAPYQPFHTDKRVNLNAFNGADHHLSGNDAWVFGEEIPTTQVISGSDDSDDAQLGPEASMPMDNMGVFDDFGHEEHEEHAVVTTTTTRKKKGKKAKQLQDDENFDNSVMIDFARDRV